MRAKVCAISLSNNGIVKRLMVQSEGHLTDSINLSRDLANLLLGESPWRICGLEFRPAPWNMPDSGSITTVYCEQK